MSLRRFATEGVGVLLILLLAVALATRCWTRPVVWTNDGLFYAAQTLEVRGSSAAAARHAIFDGAPASKLRNRERASLPYARRRVDNARWVDYSARFYRRRWLVPALAAPLYPAVGPRSVLAVSLIGYVLAGVLIYALLRQRFRIGVSVAASAACLLLPSFREWSFAPLTDSWGVALEAGALGAGVLVLRRGLRFIPLWMLGVAALSLTRDATLFLLGAAAWLAIRDRTPKRLILFASGLAAAIPVPLLAGAPGRQQLAWAFADYHVPKSTSWSFIFGHYGAHVREMLSLDVRYHLLAVALVIATFAALAADGRRGGDWPELVAASAAISLLYLALTPVYTGFRLELALLPMVAAGGGVVLERTLRTALASRAPRVIRASPKSVS